jgi:hypothetical protein
MGMFDYEPSEGLWHRLPNFASAVRRETWEMGVRLTGTSVTERSGDIGDVVPETRVTTCRSIGDRDRPPGLRDLLKSTCAARGMRPGDFVKDHPDQVSRISRIRVNHQVTPERPVSPGTRHTTVHPTGQKSKKMSAGRRPSPPTERSSREASTRRLSTKPRRVRPTRMRRTSDLGNSTIGGSPDASFETAYKHSTIPPRSSPRPRDGCGVASRLRKVSWRMLSGRRR